MSVAKSPEQQKVRTTLRVKAGNYHLAAPDVLHEGRYYRAKPDGRRVTVQPGDTTTVSVKYSPLKIADRLSVVAVKSTSVALKWRRPPGVKVTLRRTTGERPARRPDQGTGVSGDSTHARDTRVKPGRTYSYALFTKTTSGWEKPLAQTVRVSGGSSTEATYVASPTTTFLDSGDTNEQASVANGVVSVHLGKQSPAPLLGAAFVLAQSTQLPGGYLGTVSAISSDGRTVALAPAGLADAFDYYDIDTDLATLPPVELTPITDPAAAKTAIARYQRGKDVQGRASKALPSCLGGSLSQQIRLKPILQPGGHFSAGVRKKWFVPTGAWLDMSAKLTLGMTMDVETELAISCGLPFKPVMTTITTSPVPISMLFWPVAEIASPARARCATSDSRSRVGSGPRPSSAWRRTASPEASSRRSTPARPR